jgi:hypothetical protein
MLPPISSVIIETATSVLFSQRSTTRALTSPAKRVAALRRGRAKWSGPSAEPVGKELGEAPRNGTSASQKSRSDHYQSYSRPRAHTVAYQLMRAAALHLFRASPSPAGPTNGRQFAIAGGAVLRQRTSRGAHDTHATIVRDDRRKTFHPGATECGAGQVSTG